MDAQTGAHTQVHTGDGTQRRRLAVTGGRLALIAVAAVTGIGAVSAAGGAGHAVGAVLVDNPAAGATVPDRSVAIPGADEASQAVAVAAVRSSRARTVVSRTEVRARAKNPAAGRKATGPRHRR